MSETSADTRTRSSESEGRRVRRLSGNDAVFVYGETPTMPMHTMGTMILDPSDLPSGFDTERVVKTIRERIHRMPPFRQRLLEIPMGLGHPVLVDDPEFRLEDHVRRIGVPAPGGLPELAEVVAHLAETPLERSKPLWEMWVVDGLAGGRLALVTKLHHCIMDGASGSAQMAGLLDLEPDALPAPPVEPWDPAPLPSAIELARISATSRLVGPVRIAGLLSDTIGGAVRRARAEREIEERGEPRPGWQAPRTLFNRSLTSHRSVAFGSVPLEEVKAVKRAFGVTVNDVRLAIYSLVVRRYLLERDALPEEPLTCSMAVSLKSDEERKEFSNKVSATSVLLPTNLEDPEAVMVAVHTGASNAKAVLEAVAVDIIPQWLELAPPLLTPMAVRSMVDLHLVERTAPMINVLLSNVMGPPIPLYFGGARVEAVYPMGPVGEGMGLNVTVLSNMGRLDIGVMACREAVPDPWEITRGFSWALGELQVAAERRT